MCVNYLKLDVNINELKNYDINLQQKNRKYIFEILNTYYNLKENEQIEDKFFN